MAAGLIVYNDAGIVQIDSEYPNYFLWHIAVLTSTNTGMSCYATLTFPALPAGVNEEDILVVIGGLPYSVLAVRNTPTTTSVSIQLGYWGQSPSVGNSLSLPPSGIQFFAAVYVVATAFQINGTSGLRLRNSAGELTFDSSLVPMRIVGSALLSVTNMSVHSFSSNGATFVLLGRLRNMRVYDNGSQTYYYGAGVGLNGGTVYVSPIVYDQITTKPTVPPTPPSDTYGSQQVIPLFVL